MGELFGTDGVRGIPGRPPLVPSVIRRLGLAAARVLLRRAGLKPGRRPGSGPRILMARDSRASGAMLERHLAEGFIGAGCAPVDAGMLPTPALAFVLPGRAALCGVAVSASHNPAEFNGIKFIGADGFKLAPGAEAEIELALASARDPGACPVAAARDPSVEEDYVARLLSTFPAHLDLAGMRLALDCANGAASRIGPRLLRSLGAEVVELGCSPDGRNINRGCGALDTAAMRREVARRGLDAGISLDGDADRAIFADGRGRACDGDVLLALAAVDLQDKHLLRGSGVAVTVMSNYALIRFLEARGIAVTVVPVGDRNVTEAIERGGLALGGEASGHIVFRRFCPTGDGLLTALQVLAVLAGSGRPLAWHRDRYAPYPQVLRNVRADSRVPIERLPRTSARVREFERRLRGAGRVFVRYSGTEPLLRIMLEGPDKAAISAMAGELARSYAEESAARR